MQYSLECIKQTIRKSVVDPLASIFSTNAISIVIFNPTFSDETSGLLELRTDELWLNSSTT